MDSDVFRTIFGGDRACKNRYEFGVGARQRPHIFKGAKRRGSKMTHRFGLLALFVCVVQLTLSNSAFAQDGVIDCDKYAASDTDPSAKAPGVPLEKVDPALAVPACAAAVRQFPNNPRLVFQLGRAHRTADNFHLALEYYRKAAEQNYAAAQNSLGYAYAHGQGVPADDQQAIAWYRKAADQGSATAQNNLGIMYLKGQGVPRNTQQAFAWFGKAADQGLAAAQSNLDALLHTVPAEMTPAHVPLSPVQVPLQREGSNFVVPVLINNAITLNFVVDSGASDVSVPADVVATLLRSGTLTDRDFIGEQTYVLADGSRVPSLTFRIRSLTVGDWLVEDVIGNVAPLNGLPLLGESFLSRFSSWSIDNTNQSLVLTPAR
jgi:TPR repeat protein